MLDNSCLSRGLLTSVYVGKRKDHDFTVDARLQLESEDGSTVYLDDTFTPMDIGLNSGEFVKLNYSFTTGVISEQG